MRVNKRAEEWTAEEVFPAIDRIALILLEDLRISAVALTGSTSRCEFPVGDIDLIVLCNGEIPDGSWKSPVRWHGKVTPPYVYPIQIGQVFDSTFTNRLSSASGGIPVDYIFVHEKALWSCVYLRTLEAREGFPDFFLRVFCDPEGLPLILLRAHASRGAARSYITRGYPNVDLPHTFMMRIRHICLSDCKPKQPWEQARQEMLARKGCL